jgi:hypothetical protein
MFDDIFKEDDQKPCYYCKESINAIKEQLIIWDPKTGFICKNCDSIWGKIKRFFYV